MPAHTVELDEHCERLIAAGIKSGEFGNATEAIHKGLRLLEERQTEERTKASRLRDAIQVGVDEIERGEGIAFDSVDDLAVYLRELGTDVRAEMAGQMTRG